MKVINLNDQLDQTNEDDISHFGKAVGEGLLRNPKKLSSQFFYDDIGSDLFQKITQQEEYYLTRAELEILKENASNISKVFKKKEIDVVELGVGDGHKTKILIQSFIDEGISVNFYPIDISKKAIDQLKNFIKEGPLLNITAVIANYFDGLNYINTHSKNQKLVLLLGSNIGNTDEFKGESFLSELNEKIKRGDLLLTGFDLVKDLKTLNNAYNDKDGYTKLFNLNLLKRMNRELGANFEPLQFEHIGRFNPVINAMESYLVSKINQKVELKLLNIQINFSEFEPIHLEYSYKYDLDEIKNLSSKAGFQYIDGFTDSNNLFVDSLWQK